jgi:betaine lipid synthase
MSAHVSVPDFFSRVYLVDFSPSLCEVARKRFARLGWDVRVVCQDARLFRLEDYEDDVGDGSSTGERPKHSGAALVTMSYSLSMIVSLRSCGVGLD